MQKVLNIIKGYENNKTNYYIYRHKIQVYNLFMFIKFSNHLIGIR